jgi:hypothetical protein
MKTKSLRKEVVILVLLFASVLLPEAYAQSRVTLKTTPRAGGLIRVDEQKRVASETFVRTELFFGVDRLDGPVITEEEWNRFLDEEITPRFPDGLTLLTGIGQFRNSNGKIVQERSKFLILLYPLPTWKSSDEKIEEIRAAYKRIFKQQSVMRVDDPLPVWISF